MIKMTARRVLYTASWIPVELVKKFLTTDWEIVPYKKGESDESIFNEPFEVAVGSIPKKVLENLKNLKYNIFQGAGVDWIDFDYYKQAGITLINCHANARTVAEHGFALILDQCKRVSISDRKVRELNGMWPSKDFNYELSIALSGKTLLCIGTGRIGQYIAKFAKAFGMHVIGVRRSRGDVENFDEIYIIDELNKVLPRADVVFTAIPLTKETKGLINLEKFKLMKKSAIFVNIGRGRVVDEESLYIALKKNIIRGAAIDVWYMYPWEQKEPPYKMANYPFYELENITITPHRAWTSDEVAEEIAKDIARKLDIIAKGEPIPDIVDLDKGY